VSRRARAVAFAGAAALCAGLAASATGGPGGDPAAQFGALREVVVATQPLPGDRPLREKVIRRALELRRVPERFVSPDALSSPAQALGRSPAVPVPAGGYLLDSHLQSAEAEQRHPRRLPGGRRPVEIGVQGAGALAARPGGPGRRVDVVVTSEPGAAGGGGRTYVAAEAVGLIELRPGGRSAPDDALAGPGGEAWVATLALTRDQALRLIHAESFARSVRLIGR
jgi:Flp pilus assembly protein CpaB